MTDEGSPRRIHEPSGVFLRKARPEPLPPRDAREIERMARLAVLQDMTGRSWGELNTMTDDELSRCLVALRRRSMQNNPNFQRLQKRSVSQ